MQRWVVTGWSLILLAGCSAQTLRPSAFDPSKGTAVLMLGPGADADRTANDRRLRLLGVRDATGQLVIGPGPDDQCSLAPIELNPGRYSVEVTRCTSSCRGARFTAELDAQRSHDYRIQIDKSLLSLNVIKTEWEGFLADETADSSRSLGKAIERCD